MSFKLLLLLGVSISIGIVATGKAKGAPRLSTSVSSVDGFGSVKFGMSFEEVVALFGADRFNGFSLKECRRQLTSKGCLLFSASEAPAFAVMDAIPYAVSVFFNRHGKATQVQLDHRVSVKATIAQCQMLFSRTIDWVVGEFGPLESASYIRGEAPSGQKVKTQHGNFFVEGKGNSGVYIPEQLFRRGDTYLVDGGYSKKSIKLRNRSVGVNSIFVDVTDRASCHVAVTFREPDGVEGPWQLSDEAIDEKVRSIRGSALTDKTTKPRQ